MGKVAVGDIWRWMPEDNDVSYWRVEKIYGNFCDLLCVESNDKRGNLGMLSTEYDLRGFENEWWSFVSNKSSDFKTLWERLK